MTVRIGINPIGWSNDDEPSLGADITLETCLAQARDAGFTGVELGHKFPRSVQALRRTLARYDLELVSGWYSARLLDRDVEAEMAAMQPHLDLLKGLGSEVVVFCEVTGAVHSDRKRGLSERPVADERDWTRLIEGLNAVADRLRQQGLQLAYHHHVGTVIETQEEIDRLMLETEESVGLLLDTGHLVHAGGDPGAVAARYAKRIVHVHGKDIRHEILLRARGQDKSFIDGVIDGVFTVPGDGTINFRQILRPLADVGYSGWLVVEAEQDPVKADPLLYARKGYRGFADAAAAVGLGAGRTQTAGGLRR